MMCMTISTEFERATYSKADDLLQDGPYSKPIRKTFFKVVSCLPDASGRALSRKHFGMDEPVRDGARTHASWNDFFSRLETN
jgi:hypothetical protein